MSQFDKQLDNQANKKISKQSAWLEPEREISDLSAVISRAIEEAKRLGAEQVEVGSSVDVGLATTVRLGEVETIEFDREKSFGLTVYMGQKKGSASTNDTSAESIMETVKAACDIAKYTSVDACSGLADQALMATEFPDLETYYPWSLAPEEAIELALSTENYGRAFDSRIKNSEGASVSSSQGVHVYGNSHGFLHGYPSSRHNLTCVLIAEDDNHEMQRDYWYSTALDPLDLEAARSVGETAATRTVARLNAVKPGTLKSPIIMVPEVARGLLATFISAIAGGSLYRKASFLVDHLGKPVFAKGIDIIEDPHYKKGMGSRNYDGEGVRTQHRSLVSDGILEGYVLASYSARKLGMQTTGNAGGVHNLRITPGVHDRAGLLKQMDKGILVTELMGQGINLVTGDYSRGATGFWVEGGKIQYPIEAFTIAGNLRDMFKGLVGVGNDVDKRSNIITGSLLIESMMVASSS